MSAGGPLGHGLPYNLRLPPGEDLLWTGRPVPSDTGAIARADWVILGLCASSILAAVTFALAGVGTDGSIGIAVALSGAALMLWLAWRDRHERGWSEPSDRYLFTTERAVVVKDEELFFARGPMREGAAFVSLGGDIVMISAIVPLERHALRADVTLVARHGPHLVLRPRKRLPWDAFVFPAPDDPEGALRAVERMMAVASAPAPQSA